MDIKDQKKYILLSILLLAAIVGVVGYVIVPRYLPRSPEQLLEEIDFSRSAWIEAYIDQNAGIFESDFFVNSAFTYNPRSNKMIVTYATQKSVAEVREHYLALPGASLSGRNDETSLNVSARLEGGDLRVYNYYSPISRVIELELVLPPERADSVISQLAAAFPAEVLKGAPDLAALTEGETFGGYVRYRYDELDEFSHPFIPVYSRAFRYSGTEDEYQLAIAALREAFPDYRYDQTQGSDYFRLGSQILSVSMFTTDLGETLVSVSLQENIQD